MTPEERAAHSLVWNDKAGLREMTEMYVPKDVHARIAEHIRQAILEEREACAKVCDEKGLKDYPNASPSAFDCAQAIRSRP